MMPRGGGTSSAGMVAGGTPPITDATEEWANPSYTIKTVTTS